MKKKTLAALPLVILAALAAAAQTPAGWVKFSPPGAPHLSVLLPAAPKGDKKTSESPHGPYTTTLFTSVSPAREIYLVGWVDYDPKFRFGVQAELEANRDNFVRSAKARLLSTTPIRLGAHPGIEFKAVVDGKADIVSRVYIVGRRPYQLIMLTPAGSDASANRERFFSSFRVEGPK